MWDSLQKSSPRTLTLTEHALVLSILWVDSWNNCGSAKALYDSGCHLIWTNHYCTFPRTFSWACQLSSHLRYSSSLFQGQQKFLNYCLFPFPKDIETFIFRRFLESSNEWAKAPQLKICAPQQKSYVSQLRPQCSQMNNILSLNKKQLLSCILVYK